MDYCDNGSFEHSLIEIKSKCFTDDLPCVNLRYCIQEKCIKHITNFKICKNYPKEVSMPKKKIEDIEILETKEIIELENNKEVFTKKCNIVSVVNNKYIIDFEGFGISLDCANPDKSLKSIIVNYESEIGKPDFKIYISE